MTTYDDAETFDRGRRGGGRRRRVVVIAGAAVALMVVTGGTTAWAMSRANAASVTTATVTYRTVAVTTGNLAETVAATGTIEPVTTSNLSFGAAGQVTSVAVKQGAKVKAGQVLATMTSASLSSQEAQAQANLASAQARLSSDQTASASSAQLASDAAGVTVAQAQLASAKTALAGATLLSPIAGTVSAVNLTVGQQVTGSSGSSSSSSSNGSGSGSGSGTGAGAGSGSGSGSSSSSSNSNSSTAQVQVISTGAYLVNATVGAADVANLADGEQATIIPSGSSTPVFGLVTSVGIVASSSSGTATFPVVITVTGSPAGLYAGSSAAVTITYKQLTNVLVIPTLAVSRSSGTTTVTLVRNGVTSQQAITTGLSSGGSTQVLTGLTANDSVQVAITPRTSGGGTGSGRTFGGGNGGGFGGGGFGGGGFGGGGFGGGGTGGGAAGGAGA